jgi:hypothetical protein
MIDNFRKLIRKSFEYNMTNVHTAFPGTVEKYDPVTRRADIQPYLKRKLPNGEFMDFPIIPDVPVLFFGTVNCTIHAPLEKDDEVLMMVCERATDQWRDNGGKGVEDADPRRFNLMDCFAIPGLQPLNFPKTPETGISIIYKEKHKILIDDDTITIENGDSTFVMEKEKITFDNGKNKFELSGPISLLVTGSELIEIGNAVDSLGGILDALMTSLIGLHTEGSPAAHTATAWAASDITPLKAKVAQVFKK